ncbi:MAG TPA: copper chaperone [Flavobacteriales bacterium]|nr:copper chaperone [Flavobacteriales bacterium]HIA11008.1 copper chaperone [Flavobacteriales bacterium]
MKNIIKPLLISAMVALLSVTVNAQEKSPETSQTGKVTCKFKVEGVCGMCKTKIENAAFVKGVKFASWDKNTGIIEVVYKSDKTTEQKIHESIAKSGYTTEKVKATDEAYNALPKCCRYKELEVH